MSEQNTDERGQPLAAPLCSAGSWHVRAGSPIQVEDQFGFVVATCWHSMHPNSLGTRTEEEAIANAKLIAMAPGLLRGAREASKALEEVTSSHVRAPICMQPISRARIALDRALEPHHPWLEGWIPVARGLPNSSRLVLVWDSVMGFPWIAKWDDEQGIWNGADEGRYLDIESVSHWMELPSEPNAQAHAQPEKNHE